jgi:hypothetical protein
MTREMLRKEIAFLRRRLMLQGDLNSRYLQRRLEAAEANLAVIALREAGLNADQVSIAAGGDEWVKFWISLVGGPVDAEFVIHRFRGGTGHEFRVVLAGQEPFSTDTIGEAAERVAQFYRSESSSGGPGGSE